MMLNVISGTEQADQSTADVGVVNGTRMHTTVDIAYISVGILGRI